MPTLQLLSVIQDETTGIGSPVILAAAAAKPRYINPTSIIDATPTAANGAVVRYNDPSSAIAMKVTVTQAASSL